MQTVRLVTQASESLKSTIDIKSRIGQSSERNKSFSWRQDIIASVERAEKKGHLFLMCQKEIYDIIKLTEFIFICHDPSWDKKYWKL